jgi:hypothetical protein
MVGALTQGDVKLLKLQGCTRESFALLVAIDKPAPAWQRTEPGRVDEKGRADVKFEPSFFPFE